MTEHKKFTSEMKTELDQMIREISGSIPLQDLPRINIGSEHENPVYLNRNNAGGDRGIRTQQEMFGFWKVKIAEGTYKHATFLYQEDRPIRYI